MVRIVLDSSVQIRPFWTDLYSYEPFRFEESILDLVFVENMFIVT